MLALLVSSSTVRMPSLQNSTQSVVRKPAACTIKRSPIDSIFARVTLVSRCVVSRHLRCFHGSVEGSMTH